MEKVLYVYSNENIEELKKDFSKSNIVSISYIFNKFADLDDFEDKGYDEYIIDLSVLAFENGIYRLVLERYLYKLTDFFESSKFLVNNFQRDAFLSKYPHIFDSISDEYVKSEDNVNISEDIAKIENQHSKTIPLFIYSSTLLEIITEKYKIISIGCLFNGIDNSTFNFNLESVKSFFDRNEIQYIDITQVIDLFNLRKDLTLTFEIILRQIFMYKNNINFLVCNEKLDDVKKYLPFTFKINTEFFSREEVSSESQKVINSECDTKEIIDIINNKLKGHDEFKKDFKFNLQKYMFLHKLGERKIFSIFLTGESGIGKTEFAKMLSEAMYPTESLIKINFGNYSSEGVLNSLIGSPPGYIGSEDGGELINKLKNSNSKIVLIDEFEKATPGVFHFFYELLEDGKFTDRHGVSHNMDGYIIIFTSNLSRKRYINNVPNPLKSRFDMVYEFLELPMEEKKKFVLETAEKLIEKIYQYENAKIEVNHIQDELDELILHNNMRSIKRKVEDVVISEYYKLMQKN